FWPAAGPSNPWSRVSLTRQHRNQHPVGVLGSAEIRKRRCPVPARPVPLTGLATTTQEIPHPTGCLLDAIQLRQSLPDAWSTLRAGYLPSTRRLAARERRYPTLRLRRRRRLLRTIVLCRCTPRGSPLIRLAGFGSGRVSSGRWCRWSWPREYRRCWCWGIG